MRWDLKERIVDRNSMPLKKLKRNDGTNGLARREGLEFRRYVDGRRHGYREYRG